MRRSHEVRELRVALSADRTIDAVVIDLDMFEGVATALTRGILRVSSTAA
jgi:hypothetical protein